jgi:hypothetical protein
MVRVTEYFLDCVAFLCVEDKWHTIKPRGTAFLVSIPDSDIAGVEYRYLITARHNLEEAKTDQIFVRANTIAGFEDFCTDRNEWYTHDNADVAAIPFHKAEHLKSIPLSVFVGAEFFYCYRAPENGINFIVSVGTEIFVVGLFIQHPGEERNLPIARFGHISRMPTEPFELPAFGGTSSFEQLAYLAECGSWGGHSGSPVFCIFYRTENMNLVRHIAFLGLDSAHFDILTAVNSRGTQAETAEELSAKINSGIAIITPAEFIRELLFRDDLVKGREAS